MSRQGKTHLTRFAVPFLLALCIFVGGMAPPAAAASGAALPQAPQIAAASATLLIHGVSEVSDHILGGCDGSTTWGPTESFLSSHGIYNYSLGYYSGDYDCGANIYTYELSHQHCINYDDRGSDDGTWNEDDRHVACELAWYIWDNYTSKGEWVNVVAHSLGGVLIKEALYQIYVNANQYFPPYLDITHIVTIAAPLAGVPVIGDEGCNGCFQVFQLIGNDNTYQIYNDLTSAAGKAVGQAEGINWIMEGQSNGTVIGCDLVGNSAFGMSYGFKIDYVRPVWQNDPHFPPGDNACQFPAGIGQWYYGHGVYLLDTSTTSDVSVNYCVGCASQSPRN